MSIWWDIGWVAVHLTISCYLSCIETLWTYSVTMSHLSSKNIFFHFCTGILGCFIRSTKQWGSVAHLLLKYNLNQKQLIPLLLGSILLTLIQICFSPYLNVVPWTLFTGGQYATRHPNSYPCVYSETWERKRVRTAVTESGTSIWSATFTGHLYLTICFTLGWS